MLVFAFGHTRAQHELIGVSEQGEQDEGQM